MKFCANCGAKLEKGLKFCSSCGTAVGEAKKEVKEETENEAATDNTTLMGILAYIIFFIPLISGDYKKSTFVKYHTNQGTILAIIMVAYSIVSSILKSVIKVNTNCGNWWGIDLGNYCKATPVWVSLPLNLLYLVLCALAVIGIVNVVNKKEKPLPVIGKLFTVIK